VVPILGYESAPKVFCYVVQRSPFGFVAIFLLRGVPLCFSPDRKVEEK
jgi:hypothetical protein